MNDTGFRFVRIPMAAILFLAYGCNSPNSNQSVKFQQYFAQGEVLYVKHCSNCHQRSGKGLALLYPPLSSSDYLEKNFEDVLCIMKYGKSGELVVNEKSFNQPMPGDRSLTDLEIAEIATYIYDTWGDERGLIQLSQVRQALKKCEP